METKKPTQLAIDGKVISIEKVAEKSLAQWKAQLKLAGLTIEDERAEFLYTELRKQIERAEKAAQEAQTQTNEQ